MGSKQPGFIEWYSFDYETRWNMMNVVHFVRKKTKESFIKDEFSHELSGPSLCGF